MSPRLAHRGIPGGPALPKETTLFSAQPSWPMGLRRLKGGQHNGQERKGGRTGARVAPVLRDGRSELPHRDQRQGWYGREAQEGAQEVQPPPAQAHAAQGEEEVNGKEQ